MRNLTAFLALTAAGVLSAAAESPFGAEVVECVTAARDVRFNNPNNVLGEPKRFVNVYYGNMGGVSSSSYGGVVHPVVPAYMGGVHLSLVSPDDEEPGYVVIAFDHDVLDDPDNPFGVDFIVFGNSGCTKSTTTGMTALDDPATCRLTAYGFPEESVVEVAQKPNGPWYGSDRWRTSDGFAPTLGHRYDPANADTDLYSGNLWWGAPTDPTYPVDPRVTFSNCAGLTLAELCQRYNGSAGGASYDLAYAVDEDGNELPADAAHGGRKWFRYVRISSMWGEKIDPESGEYEGDFGFSEPEVDAVADVAPVSGYRQWVLANFSWADAWKTNLTAEAALAPNGLPHGLNCVYGLKPTDTVATEVPFEVASFTPGETQHVITMRSPKQLTAVPKGLVVSASASLAGGWRKVVPTFVSSVQEGGVWLNTFTLPKDGATFFKLSLDE